MPSQHLRLTGTGYRITFLDDDEEPILILDCEDIERLPWGLITTITVRAYDPTPILPPDDVIFLDRINIHKSMERSRMANRMRSLMDGPPSSARFEWERYLETASLLIAQDMARPVESQPLGGLSLPPVGRFVVVGFLAKSKANILYGAGGVGKSALALRLAGSVFTGGTFFGHDVMDTGETLYCDWEDDADTMTLRLDQVSRGMALSSRLPLRYMGFRGRGSYDRHHHSILQAVRDHPTTLVVIDSTAMAMQGMPGDMAEQAIRFYSLIAEIPATVLLLDHVASDDVKAGQAAKPYGSVFKVNAARNVWEAQGVGPTGLLLRHRKTNVGPRMKELELSVNWATDSVTYRAVGSYIPRAEDEGGYASGDDG